MKKAGAVFLALLFVLTMPVYASPAVFASQNEGLSLNVGGELKTGKVFTVTVVSDSELCALELDVSYDAKALAFLSVKAIPSGGSVRYIRSDSGVRVIYACAEPHQGSMIIFRFKALSNVQTSPVFTPIEAAESDTVLRSYDSALQLDLSIGQKSSSRTSPVSKTTVPRTTSGERERVDPRSLSERDSSANESGPVGRMDLRDHTRSVMQSVFLPAGLAALLAITLTVGILIGKRLRKKPSDPHDGDKND